MPSSSRASQETADSSGAHHYVWHPTGAAMLAAMLETIEAARESVRLEMYTFTDSEIGRRFRDALGAAAGRGVQVRLLIDAVGSLGLSRTFFPDLESVGGEVRWFNSLRLSTSFFRDHRKLLVVDDASASITGCNISEDYNGDGIDQGWYDLGATVRGPVVVPLAAEFDRQWNRSRGVEWRFPRAGNGVVRCGTDGEVTALLMKPGFGKNPLRDAFRDDVRHARDIAIACAYFLPSHRLRRLLNKAVKRGAKVRLLLAGKTDVPLMQLATRSLYRRLIRGGSEVHEYQPQILHAKMMVLDDVVYVGSANLDPRSLYINFELMLRIRNPALAAMVRERFEDDLASRSARITREWLQQNHGWWRRLKQRLAYWLLARLDTELAERKLRAWRLRREARIK